MSILNAIFQGIIQGLTEFLPISSSGHLSLFQHFTGSNGSTALLFTVLLHMGTLAAVFIVYYKTIWNLIVEFFRLIGDIFRGKFKWKEMSGTRRMLIMFIISCVPLLLLLIPVGGGKNLKDILAPLAEDSDIVVEGVCFLITAFLLLYSAHKAKIGRRPRPQANTTDAIAVGIAQVIAAGFPGISRSGSTISTGIICGVDKEYMVEYSFILGIPAILAANMVEIKDAVQAGSNAPIVPTVIGVVVAAVVGVIAIKILTWLVAKNHFSIFGYYCLVLGLIVIGLGTYEHIVGQTIPQIWGWVK